MSLLAGQYLQNIQLIKRKVNLIITEENLEELFIANAT